MVVGAFVFGEEVDEIAGGAGVQVDFHAHRHFDDLRGLPAIRGLPNAWHNYVTEDITKASSIESGRLSALPAQL